MLALCVDDSLLFQSFDYLHSQIMLPRNPNFFPSHSHRIQYILIVSSVACFFVFESNVEGITSSLGNNYQWNSRSFSCSFNSEFISNMTCYLKRINRTSENIAGDIFLKPGIRINGLFVRNHTINSFLVYAPFI